MGMRLDHIEGSPRNREALQNQHSMGIDPACEKPEVAAGEEPLELGEEERRNEKRHTAARRCEGTFRVLLRPGEFSSESASVLAMSCSILKTDSSTPDRENRFRTTAVQVSLETTLIAPLSP